MIGKANGEARVHRNAAIRCLLLPFLAHYLTAERSRVENEKALAFLPKELGLFGPLTPAPVTPSAVSTAVLVPRRRFQRGSLVEKSGRWYGVYRFDALQSDGTFKREQCWQPLGLVSEQSERSARKQFQPYLDAVNDAAKRSRTATAPSLECSDDARIRSSPRRDH